MRNNLRGRTTAQFQQQNGKVEALLAQRVNYREWLKENGGVEHPTQMQTLQKVEQLNRISWLKKHCFPVTSILDIGCNWGYVLNELNGECGVDINIENIDKAMREFPTRYFMVGDVTKPLPFKSGRYSIVVMADILEHIEWQKVGIALAEALRIARNKVLITLPFKSNPSFALCFKHKWVPTKNMIGMVVAELMTMAQSVVVECDGNFVYIEVRK